MKRLQQILITEHELTPVPKYIRAAVGDAVDVVQVRMAAVSRPAVGKMPLREPEPVPLLS
jgi:hypothetical protein